MINKQINSKKEGSKPWYESSVADGRLTIDKDNDDGVDRSTAGESTTIPANGFVGVSNEGHLVTDYPPVGLRAKLAWYELNGELCVLEFVED